MLEIRNVSKSFLNSSVKNKKIDILSQIKLTIQAGEFFSLLGPSGCGKTTLLRIIAGFEQPNMGDILLQGQSLLLMPPQLRPFNMVFQRHALFPHMSVFENVAFGLRQKRLSETDIQSKVMQTLDMVQMTDFANRRPNTLSGGQSQRVAVARALVNQPKLLLLDEPLSALDKNLREQIRSELKDLQKKLNIAFIFVTHDQEEAFSLSDRVAILNQGRIEQVGTPIELYSNPANQFVSQFVGELEQLPLKLIRQLQAQPSFKIESQQ